MVDKKITELTAYTSPIDTDVIAIVDVTTPATKKVTWANVKESLPKSGDNLLLNPEFQVGATANLPLYWALRLTPTLALAADTLFPALGGNQLTITGAGAAQEGIYLPGTATNWLKIKPSTTYTVSFDYKVTAGDTLWFGYQDYNDGTVKTLEFNDSTTLTSTTATRVSYTFTTDTDANNLLLIFKAKADGDIVIVSHPKLEEGSIATPFEPCHARTRLTSKIITATRDMTAASGSVSYTGLDFTPTSIQCFALINGTIYTSYGFADSSGIGACMVVTAASTNSWAATLIDIFSAAAAYQTAVVGTYDANVGFTLSWVKSGSPTGTATLYFLCFR